MSLEDDLIGISQLMRAHIEIRNRSFMKRVHRDCFIGSDAVDFLVTQGFADNRTLAVSLGQAMISHSYIRSITGSKNKFKDAYLYYRFTEDDHESASLSPNHAGNGSGTYLGQGGCKFSFCPHTVHNSYVLDIALAEEIERAVAGASIESRARAIGKLRSRVREQALDDAPDWSLVQSTQVNKVSVGIYQRKRPRGDFNNIKMTGIVGESPKGFIKGIMLLETRKQWESMFEDGFIVEAIDIGEKRSPILVEDEVLTKNSPTPTINSKPNDRKSTKANPVPSVATTVEDNYSSPSFSTPALPENISRPQISNLARKTDDVLTFLQTVDLAGIPSGMPIGFLNDPERQHALAHLRKQMMLSNPQECMLCEKYFDSAGEIRFCPCCAMVSCGACVSKRVFEVVSRQVVSVCIHCYRGSSRIRHPPQAVQDNTGIDVSVRGKWWRPEELGIVDYSQSLLPTSDFSQPLVATGVTIEDIEIQREETETLVSPSNTLKSEITLDDDDDEDHQEEGVGDGIGLGVNEAEFVHFNSKFGSPSPSNKIQNPPESVPLPNLMATTKTARCKSCGLMISRDIEAIEEHMETCKSNLSTRGRLVSQAHDGHSLTTIGGMNLSSKHLTELQQAGTRIVYRTARNISSKSYAPREVCVLQDSFMDPEDGTCYVYEVSVRHCDVRGLSGYVTADVMLLMYVAKPLPGNKNGCSITIISQVDTRQKGSQWLLSFMMDDSISGIGNDIGILRRDDLIRELKACGNLENILEKPSKDENIDEGFKVSLDDFDLLAVLGRGGFGKVMQVRHRPTGAVYAMKILKKTELRRRRQVERTHTEKTILAAIRHPFIVGLHYAFQNSQKLYMVMDMVQGGDFFTLMRKFRKLPEDWVRIYVSEIAMALQHLHDTDVVYRDLKPENILLDGEGHIKLTDFGLSRHFETRPPLPEDIISDDRQDIVTRSFCGTEQYMSPEMLLQQGHNFRTDWWCLGLLMHEMISARHPFHGPTHYDTLRNMVTKSPTIDARLSPAASTVVKGFLIKNPKLRLCCKDGISELKTLPQGSAPIPPAKIFFCSIDWDALYDRKIEMPYKPELKDDTDLSSFEATFTREAPIDSLVDGLEKSKGKTGGKTNAIMKFFGMTSNAQSGKDDEANPGNESDVFKGFSFTKDEESADSIDSDNPPEPPTFDFSNETPEKVDE